MSKFFLVGGHVVNLAGKQYMAIIEVEDTPTAHGGHSYTVLAPPEFQSRWTTMSATSEQLIPHHGPAEMVPYLEGEDLIKNRDRYEF